MFFDDLDYDELIKVLTPTEEDLKEKPRYNPEWKRRCPRYYFSDNCDDRWDDTDEYGLDGDYGFDGF